jgi:NTP pyrophosphatase (non-canonical NTP hydrolase)
MVVDNLICTDSIEHFGKDYILTVCMEECAELIQAISKTKREPDNPIWRDGVTEEIADVMICIEYLMQLYSVPEKEIQDKIDFKQDRTVKRMGENANVQSGEESK